MGLDADFYIPLTANVAAAIRIVGCARGYADGEFLKLETPERYFGPRCTRGNWPALRVTMLELLEVAPGLHYGAGDYPPAPDEVTPAFIAKMDQLWIEALQYRASMEGTR